MTYAEIVRFHGHECPGLAIGYRMAMAAQEGIEAMRAEDEEVVAIVENDACGVDALQCVTGCTFGKGNLLFRDYGKQVYTVYNRSTREGVRVHFHGKGVPEGLGEDRSARADWILSAPSETILSVSPVSVPEPEPARIRQSIPCAYCGETAMESRIRYIDGKQACMPCYESKGAPPTDERTVRMKHAALYERLYERLKSINARPAPYEYYTADVLWTDPHIAKQMLKFHLDQGNDAASRKLTFIKRSVDWMQSRFGIGPGTRIADFGCGPGLYATRLAAKGASVTGIDFSRGSLQYAEESASSQGVSVDFVHANYLEYTSESRFDLIIMISCDFCALSPNQRSSLLRVFDRHLAKDGVVVLDVSSESAFAQRRESSTYSHMPVDGFWAAEDYYEFKNTFKYDQERVALDKYTIVTSSREFVVYNWLQYYGKEQLREEFARNGFEIESWYANVAGDAYREDNAEIAIVAQRADAGDGQGGQDARVPR